MGIWGHLACGSHNWPMGTPNAPRITTRSPTPWPAPCMCVPMGPQEQPSEHVQEAAASVGL